MAVSLGARSKPDISRPLGRFGSPRDTIPQAKVEKRAGVQNKGMRFNWGPSGGHHVGGLLFLFCPPTTFEGGSILKFMARFTDLKSGSLKKGILG